MVMEEDLIASVYYKSSPENIDELQAMEHAQDRK